ncbi:hypothetical protein [Hoeflea sp. IMCC20628]|uniref:hypothetical protein n=1 Tax=Hoeflea sp. IMCC20628 TaxID=1620421 RepID=UPI0012E080AC|nr:hypothetical protein [Hoeflea sp. IMCC20628]
MSGIMQCGFGRSANNQGGHLTAFFVIPGPDEIVAEPFRRLMSKVNLLNLVNEFAINRK